MSDANRHPAFHLQSIVLHLSGWALLLGTLAVVATRLIPSAGEMTGPIVFAIVTVWICSVLSLTPLPRAVRRGPTAAIGAYLAGMLLRMAACLIIGMLATLPGYLPVAPTLIAMAAFYLPMCILEAALVARALARPNQTVHSPQAQPEALA